MNIDDDKAMYNLISSSIGTKFVSRWSQLMCQLALKAVHIVSHDIGGGKKEVDIKRYAKVEKIPGGEIEDSRVLDGVMLNKDITHPSMRRRIENPRVILLDCPLEYKKGESQTNIEISKEEDWNRILQIEEEQIRIMTSAIVALKPDLVITEKGISDLAQHFLVKNNVTAIRRVRKTDNNRIARATGATIVNRVDDLQESDVGTHCGLFEIEKIGDEYFSFLTKCKFPKACTILLRGPSKDVLNEIERNLQDAMSVARNVIFHPRLSPGGGATEMAVSVQLAQKAKAVEGIQQWPYKAVAEAMEVIPRTLIQNSGGNPVRVLTRLRAKHAEGHSTWGIDGDKGVLVDMKGHGVWEPEAVKLQSIKTAVEVRDVSFLAQFNAFIAYSVSISSLHAFSSESTTFAARSRQSKLAAILMEAEVKINPPKRNMVFHFLSVFLNVPKSRYSSDDSIKCTVDREISYVYPFFAGIDRFGLWLKPFTSPPTTRPITCR